MARPPRAWANLAGAVEIPGSMLLGIAGEVVALVMAVEIPGKVLLRISPGSARRPVVLVIAGSTLPRNY